MCYTSAMNTQTSSATIKINLPPGILKNASEESKRIGISLQDFIRMLMATYFARGSSIRALSRDQGRYDQAMKEIQLGEFTTIRSESELDDYVNSL